MNEEKKEEDLLNKCMQSMSIQEQGEHVMLTWESLVYQMRTPTDTHIVPKVEGRAVYCALYI
jgi:hypothetical protein